LEDLVARIDTPQLAQFSIKYLDQPDFFQLPQLSGFINCLNHEIFQFGNAVVFFEFITRNMVSFAFNDDSEDELVKR